ncbi:FHA domain-containing protein [Noviherbaspirillum saxi]|uniref:YscD cytoplasmic domain-containing protein n=1 Tax=Noviherbaspirillum saxi TaxID=2320863 RepID=A0A3A3FGD5_9BURK|nr:FHA domain-containing protein [Noviherbaspirillum saxi]RJF92167.1 hypothetical protein D3871_26355 [Noviherbaspirillum saxi]
MELRMLSGLHRGAVLELDDEELALGASDNADVIVVDPGVAPLHLQIRKENDGHVLVPGGGVVLSEDGWPVAQPVRLAPGMRFSLGGIWIGFYEADAAWEAPPAEPLRVPDTPFGDVPPAPDMAGADSTRAVPAADQNAPQGIPLQRRVKRPTVMIAVVLFLAPLLIWIATAAHARFGGEELNVKKAGKPSGSTSRIDNGTVLGKPSRTASVAPSAKPEPRIPIEQLLAQFKQQLAQRELLDRVDLIMGDTLTSGWEARGALDAEEEGRLTRLINSFSEMHRLPFMIRVKVVPLKDMLPFQIVEVTSGSYANIVTDSGERLFVGDTLQDYRLVAIAPTKIVFAGKRRIELPW